MILNTHGIFTIELPPKLLLKIITGTTRNLILQKISYKPKFKINKAPEVALDQHLYGSKQYFKILIKQRYHSEIKQTQSETKLNILGFVIKCTLV